jgi:hypothetical protein
MNTEWFFINVYMFTCLHTWRKTFKNKISHVLKIGKNNLRVKAFDVAEPLYRNKKEAG